jgi:hypothetical protein
MNNALIVVALGLVAWFAYIRTVDEILRSRRAVRTQPGPLNADVRPPFASGCRYGACLLMNVLADNALTINLVLNTLIFWLIARIYLIPRLSKLEPHTVLVPILLLHSTRHLGLMFPVPGATYAGLPSEFAHPAALGDFFGGAPRPAGVAGGARSDARCKIIVVDLQYRRVN